MILAISSTVFAQKKLQYNLKVGDNFTVEQVAKQYITQDLEDVEQVLENHLIGVMNFEVVEVTKANYTLLMTFKRLKMLMSSPTLGELSNSDTESDDVTDITAMLFKGILNIPVTLIMEKSGKITSVTGGDKLIDNMFKTAVIDDPEIIAASREQMEKQFGSEALSSSLEQMTYFYPIDTVSVGDEWTNTYNGNLSAENVWTLESMTDKVILISGDSSTTMTTIDENISMTLSGKQESQIVVNPKNGLFNSITITLNNAGNTLLKTQNVTIPTQINSTITYKISQ